MTRLILALAGVTAVFACSDGRTRDIPAEQAASRTLEADSNLASDSSLTLSRRNEQAVSPVEQQVTKSQGTTSVTKPKKTTRKRPRPAQTAPAAEDSVAARAYAPNPTNSASVSDTVAAPADTTTRTPEPAVALAPDTVAKGAADTASTASSARADSMVALDTTPTPAPDSGAVATARVSRTLPSGTEIHAALDDSINSKTDTVGRTVSAVVTENVTGSDGKTIVAAGTPVQLTVTRLTPARSKGSKGALGLRVDGITLDGQLQQVTADVQPVPQELRGRGVTGNEAAKVGVGTAAGAVLGRVLGGNTKGAVIGGVVGAAGGAVVASQTATRDVVVKARTPVVFVLTAPLVAAKN